MGVYYYTLGKTGRVKAVVNGETKTLFPFAYRWKFYGSAFGPLARTEARVLASVDSKARQALAHPEFSELAFIGEKPVEGEPVYKLLPGRVEWVDTNAFPGTEIGRLKKVGRSWQVVPSEEMPSENEVQKFWHSNLLAQENNLPHSYGVCKLSTPFSKGWHAVALYDKDNNFVKGFRIPNGRLSPEKVLSLNPDGEYAIPGQKWLRETNREMRGEKLVYFRPSGDEICVRG